MGWSFEGTSKLNSQMQEDTIVRMNLANLIRLWDSGISYLASDEMFISLVSQQLKYTNVKSKGQCLYFWRII